MIDCIEKQQQQPQHLNQQHSHHHLQNQQQNLHHQSVGLALISNSRQPDALTSSQQQQALLTMYPSNQTVQQVQTSALIEVSGQQQQQQQQSNNNELIGYYFGSISRETAEWILKTHGNQMEGAYLLRSSGSNDDFVLSLMVTNNNINNYNKQAQNNATSSIVSMGQQQAHCTVVANSSSENLEVLHYKIVETEDSFVALHGQVGDEKFATIDELIEKAQGVATKPRWPVNRQSLESQILPPTYWGLSVDQIRLAILLKAKQWGFPLLSAPPPSVQFQQQPDLPNNNTVLPTTTQQHITDLATNNSNSNNSIAPNATTLNNETIRTLIYKSLHEFQPWFHGKISRDEAERRIEEDFPLRDGRFLVRERDNYSYAMCISHKKTTKHYRIDVLPTGELAIQDGRKFTSLMALVSHYTIMSDGLWCALTEACSRPIQQPPLPPFGMTSNLNPNRNHTTNGYTSMSDIGLTTITTPSIGGGNIFSNQLSHVRIASANQHHNTASINQNQNNNLYCVPPIGSNGLQQQQQQQQQHLMLTQKQIESLSTTAGSIQSQISSSSSSIDGGKVNGSTKNHHQQQLQLQTSNSLVCSHHTNSGGGGGVTSIKAPIKEWLQTINHKWSQLLAAKSQHQSLNSFLFGNQNPLNNHCHRHNHHRNQHHMNQVHRRKCKNGHSSCGCIQQMIIEASVASNRLAPVSTLNQALSLNGNHDQAPILHQISLPPARLKDQEICNTTKVHQNCCSATTTSLCPATMIANNRQNQQQPLHQQQQQLALQNNLPLGDLSVKSCAAAANTNNSLLSCLPQNSGFTLSSQSFIGSSLFAVKPVHKNPNNNHQELGGHHSGSSSGDSSGISVEEKLISPAESSANVNNLYNTDIYGSQTSTAIVNDRLAPPPPTTSSSSSSGANVLVRATNGMRQSLNDGGAHKFSPSAATHCAMVPYNSLTSANEQIKQQQQQLANRAVKAQQPALGQQQLVQAAGPILCGQHAGPAYRYTNCNDENSFKACFHRTPATAYRAADDSQILTQSSTQLAGPAAMAKFVQFQDGQCLRTHRDTRSIQMAYLSSRQISSNANNNERNFARINQVPLKELNNTQQQQQQQQNAFYLNLNNQQQQRPTNFENLSAGTFDNSYATNDFLFNQRRRQQRQQANHSLFSQELNPNCMIGLMQQQQLQQQQHDKNNACQTGKDIDLMDCGEADDEDAAFDFKYDPKLIKSSSIETLCGIGEDREDAIDSLESCKSNAELLLSLQQSCWLAANQGQQHENNILHPIPSFPLPASADMNNNQPPLTAAYAATAAVNDKLTDETNRGVSLLSSLIKVDVNQNTQLDHMKKKHDLDELTTALLAELTADLKAQVDLKNKRSGFGLHSCSEKVDNLAQRVSSSSSGLKEQHDEQTNQVEINPLELINEFDTLISNNR